MYLLYYIIYNRRNINRFLGGARGGGEVPLLNPPWLRLWVEGWVLMRITKHSRIHCMFQLGLLLNQDPRRSKKHLMG